MAKRDRNRAAVATKPQGVLFDPSMLPRCSGLIADAQSDRRAADVLHAAQLYPQAVFALQQSVEKTIKAIGLSVGAIGVAELQSVISHRAINVYLNGLKKVIAFASTRTQDPNALTMLEAWLRKGETERDRFVSITKPTSDELAKWIADHRAARDDLPNMLAATSSNDIIEAVKEAVTGPIPFDPAELPKWIVRTMIFVIALYFLALATLAHAVSTRYGDGTRNAVETYDAAHPLVVHLSDLIAIADECIDHVEAAFAFVKAWP